MIVVAWRVTGHVDFMVFLRLHPTGSFSGILPGWNHGYSKRTVADLVHLLCSHRVTFQSKSCMLHVSPSPVGVFTWGACASLEIVQMRIGNKK